MGEPGKVTDGAGALYVVNGDLTTRKAVPDVTISNGLAWGEAGVGADAAVGVAALPCTAACVLSAVTPPDVARKVMYYIDTPKEWCVMGR